MMRIVQILVLILLPLSVLAQKEEIIEKSRTNNKYVILIVNETERFYVLRATQKFAKDILLIVEKSSSQLKNKTPRVGGKYKFNTYSIFDVMHINANLSHQVDGEIVWKYKDGIDLRFTDSMGNDFHVEFDNND